MTVVERSESARRQAELVAAVSGGADVPAGFDRDRVQALATALRDKRARELTRAWPRLARALGEDWARALAQHLSDVPSPPPSGPLGDGRALARSLKAGGRLPWEGRLEPLALGGRRKPVAPTLRHRRRWLRTPPAALPGAADAPRRPGLVVPYPITSP